MIGKTISHYKIIEKLGEGGMGIVYKAEDSKLKRNVALKFLPPELTRDTEAKERFVHEARAASALQHTNICTIHAIDETEDGQLFICMDYYKGETLKKKIDQRPLKLDDAINIATQIAQGLAKAHEAEIVHRDIKPANIIITEDDEVKILDFGLVKLTGFTKLTKPGSTLGTTWYMSPEQLRGEKVDHRTDIWALGVVFYEMITGEQPFKGEYEQAVSYGILNDEPESITALRSGMPISLDGIISKALAKEAKQRYQHIDEIPVDLVNIETRPSGTSQISRSAVSGSTIQQPAVNQKVISWRIVVPLLVAAITITSIATWLLKPQPEKPVERFIHTHHPGEHVYMYDPTISPDGTKIVYGADPEGFEYLYLRKIDQFSVTTITNFEGARLPFFSPDSRELCFFTEEKLKKVFIDGGPVQNVCDVASSSGGTWGDDGTIIFAGDGLGLFRVSALGGIPKVILAPDSGKSSEYYRWPEMLPGSKAVLYAAWEGGSYNEANIAVLNLETYESKPLITGGTRPLYSPTGHILFGRSGSYWAVPFDVKGLKITGKEIPIQEGVGIYDDGAAELRFSKNGILIYIPAVITEENRTLVLVDRQGVETPLTDIQHHYTYPRFSPAGTQVAVGIYNSKTTNTNIWIHNVARGTQTPLTSDGSFNGYPIWTPDSKMVIFSSNRSGFRDIYWKRADGIGEAEPVITGENRQYAGSWSADGTLFTFCEVHPTTGPDIRVYTTKDSTATPFINTPNEEVGPTISPDGHWIAYTSDKTGRWEIYITAYPGPGREEPISTQGGERVVWAPDGRELFYRVGNKMMVVSVETRPSLKLGIPEPLFEKSYRSGGWIPQYDIHPDGDRFVMIKDDESITNQINIVLNWFEVLKKKMATPE
jgi:serine/threonine-protein kinase